MYQTYVKGQGWVKTISQMTEREIIAQQTIGSEVAKIEDDFEANIRLGFAKNTINNMN